MLSVILPVRDWPEERVEACTRSILRLESATFNELLIVDFGSELPVVSPVSDKRVRVIRAESDIWSLAEAINVGVMHAEGDVLLKTDADIIIAAEAGPALDKAAEAAVAGTIGLAVAQATDLPETVSVSAAFESASHELDYLGRLRPRWGQGGLAIFSRATWDAIGGFDSRFTGWGSEDNDFSERVRRSGRKVRWLDRDAVKIYHVWHPPSFMAKANVATPAANREIAKNDKSIFRASRIRHSTPPTAYQREGLPHPNIGRGTAPLFTVAIATAERPNRLRMLKEAIASHVGQADNDMEIVVADNGTTKDEYDLLRAELQKLRLPVRLRTMHLEEPSIPAARNAITAAAEGRYLCIADDDDIALPNRLADHLARFEKAGVHGSHGGWIDFDEATGKTEMNEGMDRSLETVLFGRGKISLHPTCCYRTDVMRAIGYDESFDLGSDFDLALRMAKAGIEVEHTHSIVLLRRFHTKNVTLTGMSNQVSNGALARRRLVQTLDPAYLKQLNDRAKAHSRPIYCNNRIGPERLVEMLPRYVGVWRLHFPIAGIGEAAQANDTANDAASLANGGDAAQGEVNGIAPEAAAPADPAAAETSPAPDIETVARVLDIVDGDVAAIDCGINMGFKFVSRPIKGASRALRIKRLLAELGIDAGLVTDRDFQDRQERGFDWASLKVPKGTRRLLSEPMTDPIEVTQTLASLPPASVLRGMLSVVTDGGPKGFRYHLVTGPLKGAEGVGSAASALRRFADVPFAAVSNSGVACDF